MLLSLLPIVLLLVHGVISVDLNKNKRVPRRHTEVVRSSYNSNHPPLLENDDIFPVAVIYDQKEEIRVKHKDLVDLDVNLDKVTNNFNARSVNHPPSAEKNDFASVGAMDDYETDLLIKPQSRSIKNLGAASKENENENLTNSKRAPIGRRSQVRKVKVSKNQINAYIQTETTVNTPENNVSLVQHKDLSQPQPGTEQTVPTPKTFKRRKGLRDPVVPILESESYVFSHSGDFHYSYEGGDGTKAAERGELKMYNGRAGNAVEGSYSYKGEDGHDYSLTYTADEKGYKPIGAHLPTPPPIPPAIQRALDYLATKTTPETFTEKIKLFRD